MPPALSVLERLAQKLDGVLLNAGDIARQLL